jgi:galactokinase
VSLVEADAAEEFARRIHQLYLDDAGVDGQVFVCEIEDGAGPVTV